MVPLISAPGTPELIIILVVIILIFGASKLPELARGSGQALRIFKAETKGLKEDDKKPASPATPSPTGELNAADDIAEGEIIDEHREKNA